MDKFITKIENKDSKKPTKEKKTKETSKKEIVTKIPDFPKLYQLNNNDKIYEWSIELEPLEDGSYNMVTKHGEINGQMVRHEKNIPKGKASRSCLEQAILEAESKWSNKKEKDLYKESLEDVEHERNNGTTTNNLVVRPMLANTFSFDSYKKGGRSYKIGFPAYVQKKYDGIRCICYKKNNEIIMESRNGVKFENFRELREQMRQYLNDLPSTFHFDGELYTDKYDFETISGLVRLSEKKIKQEDLDKMRYMEYHIYDYIDTNNLNETFDIRNQQLHQILNNRPQPNVKSVETVEIEKLEDVKTFHDHFVQQGYEGIMIRDKKGIYEIQKRSKFLQKYKEFQEDEFKIIGFKEGDGDEKGCIIFECETSSKKPFSVRPRGTKEYRQSLFKDGNTFINKNLTVIYQELSTDGIPRFPVGKAIRDIY